ncbi:MAG: STAS/SEC14 domain-containing protein [Myxococcales bacterium]|nr:MAG: STAS/SEC14 domain-containing protein [Myxococcales bacterium]
MKPAEPLEAGDFETLAREIDPYLEKQGELRGLMIETESFPGWNDFAAVLSHLRFIRDHHQRIRKVAAVTDSAFASIAPRRCRPRTRRAVAPIRPRIGLRRCGRRRAGSGRRSCRC